MVDVKAKLEKIPLWFINIISVVSGIATILSTCFSVISLIRGSSTVSSGIILAFAASLLFNVLLFFRIRKYANLEVLRMKKVTSNMHNLLHSVRDIYFDVMHSYKKNTLNEHWLARTYQIELPKILDNLCSVMTAYTSYEVSACIKLITYKDPEDTIDLDNATLVTFCRSTNSDHNRSSYESSSTPILLHDNTDFFEVVSKSFEKTYFYQNDLMAYDSQLHQNGERYRNSNPNWSSYYRGTIVVPIRIQYEKLYHLKQDDAYHIIGFLCVDSMSTDAFTKKHEKYNVDLVYAYADVIYILLGQYRHYLRKFETEKAKKGVS